LPENDLDLLIRCARAAGEIAHRFFKQSPKTWDKAGGQGPVTEADLAVDEMLKEHLLRARPDYGWLSEETEDNAARLSKRSVFIIDPIDGTRAFVSGQDTFSHSLAVCVEGKITEAAVFLPERDLMYCATAQGGAFLNGKPVTCSPRPEIEGADVLVAKPQLAPDLWPRGVPPITRHLRPSLAYRMCLVAEGRFDAMVTLRDAWEWDIAAGDLICREAGALVTDRFAEPLCFNGPRAQTAGVLAANPVLHAEFMDHLRP